MSKIVLDAESFKALASDTRLQILKALDARPLTVSEMSRLLDLNKATVFEHLKQLMAADLAKREEDPARKWVYYKLTWKGRNVLHPENAQIFLLLGLGAFGVTGAVLQSFRVLADLFAPGAAPPGDTDTFKQDMTEGVQEDSRQNAPAAAADNQTAAAPLPMRGSPPDDEVPDAAGTSQTDWYLLGALGLLLVLVSLIAWTLYSRQRSERRAVRELLDQFPADVNKGEAPAA